MRHKIHEGDLYKTITIEDHNFIIYYGYYEDYEREWGEPVPIYPDLTTHKVYTKDGYQIVTQIQNTCKYVHKKELIMDDWCRSCMYYKDDHSLISICMCEDNKGGSDYEKIK